MLSVQQLVDRFRVGKREALPSDEAALLIQEVLRLQEEVRGLDREIARLSTGLGGGRALLQVIEDEAQAERL